MNEGRASIANGIHRHQLPAIDRLTDQYPALLVLDQGNDTSAIASTKHTHQADVLDLALFARLGFFLGAKLWRSQHRPPALPEQGAPGNRLGCPRRQRRSFQCGIDRQRFPGGRLGGRKTSQTES